MPNGEEELQVKRIASTSITELVKTVAREVFQQEIRSIEKRLDDINLSNDALKDIARIRLEGLEDKLLDDKLKERAYRPWSNTEEALLSEEVTVIIEQLAALHHRGTGGIRSRIIQMGLIRDSRV